MNDPLWTPTDLAHRWGCSVPTALDRVRTRGVPFVWLGPGAAKLTGRGAKLVRFRPRAVEAWEAEQEGRWNAATMTTAAPVPVLAGNLLRGRKARQN